MTDTLTRILKVDFDTAVNLWVIQLRRSDGKHTQIKLRPDAFKYTQCLPMGQFLLHTWFTRADVVQEQPQP